MWLPGRGIDHAPAPTIFDEEPGWCIDVEGRHVVVGVTSQRVGDPVFLQLSKVITLPYIIQASDLDHEMMQGLPPRTHHGKAVMTAVHVEKIELVWRQPEIRHFKSEQIAVERQQRLDVLDIENGMSHPQRAGAKARNRPARPERI